MPRFYAAYDYRNGTTASSSKLVDLVEFSRIEYKDLLNWLRRDEAYLDGPESRVYRCDSPAEFLEYLEEHGQNLRAQLDALPALAEEARACLSEISTEAE